MAQGDLKGSLQATGASTTDPFNATGSVSVAVGDLVFAVIGEQTSLTTTAVTDNLGNTYAAVNAGTDAGTITIRCYYSRVTIAGTLTEVRFDTTASTNDVSACADVFEGPFAVGPLDANPANTTDGTTTFTCAATGTLAQANELVVAAIALAGNQSALAAVSPFTTGSNANRNNSTTTIGYLTVAATTSVTPTFSGSSATAAQTTASFKFDAGGMSASTSPAFTTSGTLKGSGALVSSITATFSTAGVITGQAPISASASFTFSTSGALDGLVFASGAVSLSFTTSGAITGAGALLGASTVAFSTEGILTGAGVLSGSLNTAFSTTGSLSGSGALLGTTALSFSLSGVLEGEGGGEVTVSGHFIIERRRRRMLHLNKGR